jgi:hypothetical protein
MKKFIFCAFFVSLLSEGAEAIKIYNMTNLEWKCTVQENSFTLKSKDDPYIPLKLTCTTEDSRPTYSVTCNSSKQHLYIDGENGSSYSCKAVDK